MVNIHGLIGQLFSQSQPKFLSQLDTLQLVLSMDLILIFSRITSNLCLKIAHAILFL